MSEIILFIHTKMEKTRYNRLKTTGSINYIKLGFCKRKTELKVGGITDKRSNNPKETDHSRSESTELLKIGNVEVIPNALIRNWI